MAIAIIKSKKPGYANLTIRGFSGSNDNLKIAILRTDENKYFRKFKSGVINWKESEYWLDMGLIDSFAEQVIDIVLPPEITDGIAYLASKNIPFQILIKNQKILDEAKVHFLGEIIPSNFLEQNIVELDVNSIRIEGHNKFYERQDKIKFWLLILLVLLLIPAIGAAFLYLFDRHTDDFDPCESTKGRDEISFVQSCLATNPPDMQIIRIIEQAKRDNSCEVAQRMYSNKAHSGSLRIALSYAKEYDPNFYQDNICFTPSVENAIYWYEYILEKNPQHREANENLKRLDALEKL